MTSYLNVKEVTKGWASFREHSGTYEFSEKSSKTFKSLQQFKDLSNDAMGNYCLSSFGEWNVTDVGINDELINKYSIFDVEANEDSDDDDFEGYGEIEKKIRTYDLPVIVIFKRNEIFQLIDKFTKNLKNVVVSKQTAIDYFFNFERVQNEIKHSEYEKCADIILDLLKLIYPNSSNDLSTIPTYFNKIINQAVSYQIDYIKMKRIQQLVLYPIEFFKNLKSNINKFTKEDIIKSTNSFKNQISSVSDNNDGGVNLFIIYFLPLHNSNPDKVTLELLELFIQNSIENKILPNKFYYSRTILPPPPPPKVVKEKEIAGDVDSDGYSFYEPKKLKTNAGSVKLVPIVIEQPKYEIKSNFDHPINLNYWSEFNKYSSSFSKSLMNNLISCFKESLINNNNSQPNSFIYNLLSIYNSILKLNYENLEDNEFKKVQKEYLK